jgi:hypothetical protein
MACDSSCFAKIACALAAAAVPYFVKAIVENAHRRQPPRVPPAVIRVPPPALPNPSRYCMRVPDGRHYCCYGRLPRFESRRLRTPNGFRVQWRVSCS